ncbi:hypothetical protein N779_24830 [Vibrio coralliilyticus OCN008]|nr:hypothetical protein N779_24830 [Vibrio coralliilyticus OCN008]
MFINEEERDALYKVIFPVGMYVAISFLKQFQKMCC